MYIKLLLAIITFSCFACQNNNKLETENLHADSSKEVNFDENKWKIQDGNDYPYREKMLNDLITDEYYKGLNKSEILNLLGEARPDRPDTNYLYYRISESRLGLWTLHTKTLVLKFTENNKIEWMKIHE